MICEVEELDQMARDQSKMEELKKELFKLRLENEILVKESKLLLYNYCIVCYCSILLLGCVFVLLLGCVFWKNRALGL